MSIPTDEGGSAELCSDPTLVKENIHVPFGHVCVRCVCVCGVAFAAHIRLNRCCSLRYSSSRQQLIEAVAHDTENGSDEEFVGLESLLLTSEVHVPVKLSNFCFLEWQMAMAGAASWLK